MFSREWLESCMCMHSIASYETPAEDKSKDEEDKKEKDVEEVRYTTELDIKKMLASMKKRREE